MYRNSLISKISSFNKYNSSIKVKFILVPQIIEFIPNYDPILQVDEITELNYYIKKVVSTLAKV